ncbi:MAG: hypothetical protein KBC41_02985 [Candidatus Pacebacteria bacterium]|nr:hypothetical protein [Candidatus Paceibacterota bacterium]MBP9867016.1 hypothetical protein [Candidatus Paceibacterota bacterium]
MVNFVLIGFPAQELKRSLSTHCPILVRLHYLEGYRENEEICRCDLKLHKAEIHPSRCRSDKECPVRVYFRNGQNLEEPTVHY